MSFFAFFLEYFGSIDAIFFFLSDAYVTQRPLNKGREPIRDTELRNNSGAAKLSVRESEGGCKQTVVDKKKRLD